FAGAMVNDELKASEDVRSSSVEWTLVRAPILADTRYPGQYQVGSLGKKSGRKVSRATVAQFILDEIENGKYIRKSPLVTDGNFMRTVGKDTLAPNGFEIVGEAVNGAEAVTKYAELKPDLVTMDITMKVKDGLEAAREILAADPNARIVMVTALGQEKMLLDSIALGVRDFVVKPFTKERILSAVEKALH